MTSPPYPEPGLNPGLSVTVCGTAKGEGEDRAFEWHLRCRFMLLGDDDPIELDSDDAVLSLLENFVDWG